MRRAPFNDNKLTMFDRARSEFILGGQRSGKSGRAEMLARDWLAADAAHGAVLIATGQGFDDEMRERIERHQQDRAARVPGLRTVEEPLELCATLRSLSTPHTLLLVDCLTLWLTNHLMPLSGDTHRFDPSSSFASLCQTVADLPGPAILISNEIGLGVIPLGAEVRRFVDELGRLNQALARTCERVTLMTAGLPLQLKG